MVVSVGIDVAKDKHDAVLDTSGAVCVRPQPLRLVQQKLLTGAVIRDSRRGFDGVNVVQRQIQFSA